MDNDIGEVGHLKNQYIAVFFGNLLTFSQGCNIGWYSPALPILNSDSGPLYDGPISKETAGWIGSLLAIGAIFGGLGFGFLANWIGYKKSLLLASVPILMSWLMIIFGVYAWQICIARFLSGVTGGAVFTCLPQFVAEICSDHIRGKLNSVIQIACYTGILCGFIGGSYLGYNLNPKLMAVVPVVFLILFSFMPESPQFLLKNKRNEEAEQSLYFYRNATKKDDHGTKVIVNKFAKVEFEKLTQIAERNEQQPSLKLSDFFTPTALRAMMISPFLMLVNQFSGAFAISNYAETIFKDTGSTMDPQISSIVMAATQVLGTYIASQLMDKVGRKILLLISTSGGCLAMLITGSYSYLSDHGYDVSHLNWLPVASISIFILFSSIGILPVPYVLLAELIPHKIRRIGTTICTCTVFIGQSIMLKLMPIMLASLQLYGSMWLFACVSITGFIFTVIFVVETKGKNLDVLED